MCSRDQEEEILLLMDALPAVGVRHVRISSQNCLSSLQATFLPFIRRIPGSDMSDSGRIGTAKNLLSDQIVCDVGM